MTRFEPDRTVTAACLLRFILRSVRAWRCIFPVLMVPGWCCGAAENSLIPVERVDQSWRVSSYAEDAHLERHAVFSLAFEANGNLWAATSDGLRFYDGYHWKRFGISEGLPSLQIYSVMVTRAGKLWVGTDKGAGIYDGRQFDRCGSLDGLAGPSVRGMAEDPDGTLWFCSHFWPQNVTTSGITSYKDGRWTAYGKKDGLPHEHVYNYFRTSGGQQYALTLKGVAQRVGDRWMRVLADEPEHQLWCMTETPGEGPVVPVFSDRANQVWQCKADVWQRLPCNPDLAASPLLAITATRDHAMMAPVFDRRNHRIWQWKRDGFVPVSAPLAVGGRCIAEAPDGSIWSGGGSGLSRWSRSGGEWTEYSQSLTTPRGLDDMGRILCGEPDGQECFRFDGREFTIQSPGRVPRLSGAKGSGWHFTGASGEISELKNGTVLQSYSAVHTGLVKVQWGVWDAKGCPCFGGTDAAGRNAVAVLQDKSWATHSPDALQGKKWVEGEGGNKPVPVVADPRRGLWILMRSGETGDTTSRFCGIWLNGEETSIYPIDIPGMDFEWLFAIHASPDGAVRAYGIMAGLLELDRATGHWQQVHEIGGRRVFQAISRPGETWFAVGNLSEGGDSGLFRCREGDWKFFPIAIQEISVAVRAWDDTVYFQSVDSPFLWFIPPGEASVPAALSLPVSGRATNLIKDAAGALWVSVDDSVGHTVYCYRPDSSAPETVLRDAPGQLRHDGMFRALAEGINRFVPAKSQKTFRYSWRFDEGPWTAFQAWPESGLPLDELTIGQHTFQIRARNEALQVDPSPFSHSFKVLSIPLQERVWFKPLAGFVFMLVSLLVVVATERAIKFKRAEAKFRDLFDQAPVGYHETDAGGHIVRVNRTEVKMLGYEPAELVGMPAWALFQDADARAVIERKLGTQSGEHVAREGKQSERTILSKDGRRTAVLVEDVLIRDGSRVLGIRSTMQDISARKQAEQNLQHAHEELLRVNEGLEQRVEERSRALEREVRERQKVEQDRLVEQERTRVAHDLHDELGAGLTEISLVGSVALEDGVALADKDEALAHMTARARDIVVSLDEIVWAVNPAHDSLQSLGDYFALYVHRFLQLAGLTCRLEVADDLPFHFLEASCRHELFLAVKEVLNNVVRHAGATEVNFRLATLAGELHLTISDNGRGLPSTRPTPDQTGLAGLRARLARLGGVFSIESSAGVGTTARLSIPLS
jgi:PAS domain S-box-containing protein